MTNSLQARIHPKLEFMNSILLTSRYNEITIPYTGFPLMTEENNLYTEAIKEHFSKYLKHPVYSMIEKMIPNGFTFSRPVELMLSLQDDAFERERCLSKLCLEYCGGDENIDELLELLSDLYDESDYSTFFEKQKGFYEPALQKARCQLEKCQYTDVVEEEMGEKRDCYHLILSSLMRGNYGIYLGNAVYSIFSTDDFSLSPGVIFHECLHPFVNPLTERYTSEVVKYKETHERLKAFKQPGFISGYGEWEECVNEHLVRAMTIHLLTKCEFEEQAKSNLTNDMNCGYRYVPMILEQYRYYDQNRTKYRGIADFYVELLQVFDKSLT